MLFQVYLNFKKGNNHWGQDGDCKVDVVITRSRIRLLFLEQFMLCVYAFLGQDQVTLMEIWPGSFKTQFSSSLGMVLSEMLARQS